MNKYGYFMKSQKGYSMVEVLVTMLIVPFGLLGVAKFQSNIMIAGSETKTRTEAIYAAEQKIEELRSFADSSFYSLIDSGSDVVSASPGSNATLNRSWTVNHSSSPNYKTVVVDVGWTGSDSQQKSVSLTSFVSMADPISSGKLVFADTSTMVPPAPVDPTSYSITVSGIITYEGNGNKTWSVAIDGTVCDSGTNSGSYSCVVTGVPVSDEPTLTVSLSTSGTACGINSVNQNFSSSINSGSHNFTHAQNSSKCS